MKIEIRSHGIELSARDRQQIERRLYIALRAFARRIDEVSVSIRDVNGPRGGHDLHGNVIVYLRRGDPIVVRAREASVPAVVSDLATATRRAVKSRIRRAQTRSIRAYRRQRQTAVVS